MGLISMIKGWWSRMFTTEAEKEFDTKIITSTMMDVSVDEWMHIYQKRPAWVSEDDNIKTVGFAKTVCEETARLTTLALDVNFDGTRAEWLKKKYEKSIAPRLREWVEFGAAVGTVILKPDIEGVSVFLPGQFQVTEVRNGKISGVIFQDNYETGNKYFTKLEYHSYLSADVKMKDSEEYVHTVYYYIQNKAYVSDRKGKLGHAVDINDTKWAGTKPDTYITKNDGNELESMLFGVFRMPGANGLDFASPLGTSIFYNAVEEMRDLDVAYSRNAEELFDSRSIELLDDRLLVNDSGKKIGAKPDVKLPHHVVNVFGSGQDEFYQLIERPLHTDQRIVGINNQLSFIGYKCGYSNGYFVFDQKTGMVTATQVEADDRRTIQLIKDIRDALQTCLNDLFYAQTVFADLYNLAPVGNYEVDYSFGDILYNHEENLLTMKNDAISGLIPKWRYVMEYYSLSEKDAKKWVTEAQSENKADSKLFDDD